MRGKDGAVKVVNKTTLRDILLIDTAGYSGLL